MALKGVTIIGSARTAGVSINDGMAFVRACVVGVRLVLIGIMCRSIY